MIIKDINRRGWNQDISDRARGKTFRAITQGLSLASDGDHVYLIVNNSNHKKFISNKVIDLCLNYFGVETIDFSKESNDRYKMVFPGGGFLHIVSELEWYRNIKEKPGVYKDYSIVEIWDEPCL